jgi:hypothetical protein
MPAALGVSRSPVSRLVGNGVSRSPSAYSPARRIGTPAGPFSYWTRVAALKGRSDPTPPPRRTSAATPVARPGDQRPKTRDQSRARFPGSRSGRRAAPPPRHARLCTGCGPQSANVARRGGGVGSCSHFAPRKNGPSGACAHDAGGAWGQPVAGEPTGRQRTPPSRRRCDSRGAPRRPETKDQRPEPRALSRVAERAPRHTPAATRVSLHMSAGAGARTQRSAPTGKR